MSHKYIAKVRTKTGKFRYIYKRKAEPIERDGVKFGHKTAKRIERQGVKFGQKTAVPIPRVSIRFRRAGAKKVETPSYTKLKRKEAKRI